ncbi:MAG: OmpA family protein [Pseudomonadota bacterium]
MVARRVALIVLLTVMFLAGLALAGPPVQAQDDEEPGRDHPLLSRMRDYVMTSHEANYDAVKMAVGPEGLQEMEGEKTFIIYDIRNGAKKPSVLQIIRNYQNALKTLNAELVFEGENNELGRVLTMKLVKNGREIWVSVNPYNNADSYGLLILELKEMEQEVAAGDIFSALKNEGRVSLYIQFDQGLAVIKPESGPIIAQVVSLLNGEPEVKISVEGHTDNMGNDEDNQKLSEKRAAAVMKALVEGGVAPERLVSVGYGPTRPIADNGSEEGRIKNRRVELVRQ